MTTILVTGGLGFVGSHFVWASAQAGHRIAILDDQSAAGRPPLPEGVDTVVAYIGGVGDRRPGDPASLVADPIRARELVGWTPKRSDLDTILENALCLRRR